MGAERGLRHGDPAGDVDGVNLGRQLVLLRDGQLLPITAMFDATGATTAEKAEARAVVAGPAADGTWRVINLAYYASGSLH